MAGLNSPLLARGAASAAAAPAQKPPSSSGYVTATAQHKGKPLSACVRADWFSAQRERLGLSIKDMRSLLGQAAIVRTEAGPVPKGEFSALVRASVEALARHDVGHPVAEPLAPKKPVRAWRAPKAPAKACEPHRRAPEPAPVTLVEPERLIFGHRLVQMSGRGGPYGGQLRLAKLSQAGGAGAVAPPDVLLEFADVAGIDSLIEVLQRVREGMLADPYTLAA